MGIEKITEQILIDAKDDARRIFDKGRYDSRDLERQAQHKIKIMQADTEKRSEDDAETLKIRKDSVAQLEGRKLRLKAKQEVISKSFDLALEKLSNMEEEAYLNLLERCMNETGMEKGEILLNKKDRDFIGQKLVNRVNKNGFHFVLSKEEISAKGGFLLRDGAVEVNSTFETMINAVREAVTPEVVKVLFN
ncbi:V-type ATP synthase subunit E [Sinanaerobacter sp. ZZT-01]|uniref:V-type ATP synthase subunit E n=1 Tax=Sinanaerobacter sp. ZZT-01 TaxID=3111540 RepID=UPI002D78B92B|nr:V-type ATP synthase subunit E [Sinanaerobacter sp. ZZT-01]WRR94600.1 V-type ATP synthase subunit E [Sinanaerobacter sp. ZZT-01]